MGTTAAVARLLHLPFPSFSDIDVLHRCRTASWSYSEAGAWPIATMTWSCWTQRRWNGAALRPLAQLQRQEQVPVAFSMCRFLRDLTDAGLISAER